MEATPRLSEPVRVCIRTAFYTVRQNLSDALIGEVLALKPGEHIEVVIRRAGEASWGDYVEIVVKEKNNTKS